MTESKLSLLKYILAWDQLFSSTSNIKCICLYDSYVIYYYRGTSSDFYYYSHVQL